MQKAFSLLFLVGWAALAQVPTISNIAALDIEHNGGRIYYTVSVPNSYVQVLWGTTSGVYQCATQATVANAHPPNSGVASFSIYGNNGTCPITPGATIYYLPTAWTNDNNYANVCKVAACGSGEHSFTTSAAVVHPVQPAAPAIYLPSHPDTSGYTVVPMTATGSPSVCVAASNVAAPSGQGWASPVTAGDSFQTVLYEVGYGTVIELPQGATCNLTPDGVGRGLYIPGKSAYPGTSGIDDPNHPWILIRTHANAITDFPPVGVRTGPQFSSHMATIQFSSVVNGGPMLYANMDTGRPHHWWFENFRTGISSAIPNGSLVGVPFYFGQNNDGSDAGPRYMVVDRVFSDLTAPNGLGSLNTQGWIIMEGEYFALMNSYIRGIESLDGFRVGIYGIEGGIGNYTIDNNFLDYVGMGIYLEQLTGPKGANDIAITHNYLTQPLTKMQPEFPGALPGVAWDGFTRYVRQPIESKGTYRMLVQGNYISGYWAMQNDAPAIMTSPTNTALPTSGTSGNADWLITDNVIRHGSTLYSCGGIRTWDNPGPPDNAVNRRIRFTNNLAYDLGRHKYSQLGAPSLLSGIVEMLPACEDVSFDHNTVGQIDYASDGGIIYYPAVETLGGGGTFLEGHYFTDNVLYYNLGFGVGNSGIVLTDEGDITPSHPHIPAITGSDYRSILQSAGGVTWARNLIIGGNSTRDGVHFTDLSSTDIATYSNLMPSGDVWMPGHTQAEREANAGLNSDWTLSVTPFNPLTAGANLNEITSSTGVVSNISVTVSASSLTVAYLAPDSRACSLDTSPDGVAWNRLTDHGGRQFRHLTATRLSASTTYQYRLMCYFDQSAALEFPADQITSGTVTTLAFATLDVPFAFNLEDYPGALSFTVSATAADGTQVTKTCRVSPCVLSDIPVGDYSVIRSYSGGGQTWTSDPQTIYTR